MSRFDQMWLPLVSRSTSAASSSSAVSGFTPTPLAAFSALATTRSTPCREMRRGTRRFTAVRPGFPKTSPRKRIFKGAGSRHAQEKVSTGSVLRPGRLGAEHPLLGHHRVERHVVGLARHLGDDLHLEGDA